MIVTVSSYGLYRGLSAVLRAASKDPTRAHLHAIHFIATETKLRLEATNGHWLAVWEEPIRESSGKPSAKSMLVDQRSCERAVRDLKTKNDEPVSTINFTKGRIAIHGRDRLPLAKVEAVFPDVSLVIPRFEGTETVPYIGISTILMAAAAKAFEAGRRTRRSTGGVRFRFKGELDPMLLDCPSVPELLVLLMPCRVEAPERPAATPAPKPTLPSPANPSCGAVA